MLSILPKIFSLFPKICSICFNLSQYFLNLSQIFSTFPIISSNFPKFPIFFLENGLPKQFSACGTNSLQAVIIEGAVAKIALIIISSIRRIRSPVSLFSAFRCFNQALKDHLCPTSSASGSELLQHPMDDLLQTSPSPCHC